MQKFALLLIIGLGTLLAGNAVAATGKPGIDAVRARHVTQNLGLEQIAWTGSGSGYGRRASGGSSSGSTGTTGKKKGH
jgi:hypothetical protein